MKNSRLVAVDHYRADSTELTATGKSKSIVPENGDEVKFREVGDESGPGFTVNGRINFIKVDD